MTSSARATALSAIALLISLLACGCQGASEGTNTADASSPDAITGQPDAATDAAGEASPSDAGIDAPPFGQVPITLPVATFPTHIGCGTPGTDPDSGTSEWTQTCAGYSEVVIEFPADGRYEFDLSAFAPGVEAGSTPELALGLDGVFAADHAVAVEWPELTSPLSTYILLANVTAGSHRVEVQNGASADGGTPPGPITFGTLSITNPAPPPAPLAVPDQYWNVVPLVWYPVRGLTPPVAAAVLPADAGAAEPTRHVGADASPRVGNTGAWAQNSNGYSEYTVVFPNAGPYELDVYAYGDEFQGAPRLQLAIDGAPLGDVDVTETTATEYPFTAASVSAGPHLVEVLYPNDFKGSGDRNLVIQSVAITELAADGGVVEQANDGDGGENGEGTYPHAMGLASPTGKEYGFDGGLVFSKSTVYPNTTRNYYVYVPTAVNPAVPAAFMVFQDGSDLCGNGVGLPPGIFDALIAKKIMPPAIAICASPGVLSVSTASCKAGDNDCERSFEYDSVNDTYYQFVVKDLLPLVVSQFALNLSTDPEMRGMGGGSSGGIAAFTVGWFHPESFRRIWGASPSFTDIRNHGGNQYPAMILAEPKVLPLHFAFSAGTHDLDCFGNVGPDCTGNPHAWADANKRVAAALLQAGYPFHFDFGSWRHAASPYIESELSWIWSQ